MDKVNNLKTKKEYYAPTKRFNAILEERGLTYHILRYDMKVQHFTLRKAMDGKRVTKRWAESFAFKINVPFNKLFELKSEEYEQSYNTKKKYVSFLKASLSYAVKKRYISENYATAMYISPLKNKEPNRKTKCMSKEEFYKLYDFALDYPDLRIKNAILLILNTGMRKEELLGLTWDNIFLSDKKLNIVNTVIYITNKGVYFNPTTKNTSSTRSIAISNEMAESLKEYKEYCDSKCIKSDFLFSNDKGDVIFPTTINSWLNKVLNEAGINHYTVHSLRHTYASLMIEETPSLIAVSRRIGHSRVSTTTDIYGHVVSNNDREIANAVLENKTHPLISYLKECVANGTMTQEAFDEAIKKI